MLSAALSMWIPLTTHGNVGVAQGKVGVAIFLAIDFSWHCWLISLS